MSEGATIAGHRLTGRTRAGELGVWHDAVSPAGVPSSVLRFDPNLLDGTQARDRVVAAVRADLLLLSRGDPPSLLPVADLVTARGEVWLITTRRATPTLAELLDDSSAGAGSGMAGSGMAGSGMAGIDPAAAVAILVETARALRTLHASGLTHGALHAGTVVVGDDGSVLLAERGLLAALRHTSPGMGTTVDTAEDTASDTTGDTAAWAALARSLARRLAQDSVRGTTSGPAYGEAAALLDRAAAVALARGLDAAGEVLRTWRDVLAPGTIRLAGAVRQWTSGGVPVAPAPAMRPGADEAVTLLDLSGQGLPGPSVTPAGRTAQRDGDMMRFGPGVPTETTAEQIWRSGQAPTARTRAIADTAQRRRGRRTTTWAGTLLLAVLIAAGVLGLRMCAPGPDLAVLKVDVKLQKKTVGCDGRADFTGVVTANGGGGTIRYEWRRSDGEKIEQEQRVRSGTTSLDFPLHWTVKGSGSFRGTATLRVLSPTTTGKPLQDKASFSYKC
ncbi:hypothetical protein ACQP1K_21705 [Sphaerimonospora sp. CA-214678]|uniref:hypothetical protein n=1 Tax=Sphaerimonospora sp. CA-214678 TaxID=3240029 RepID=UPI003D8C9DF7